MRVLLITLLLLAGHTPLQADESGNLVQQWLGKQKDLKTWSADFTQIRHFKSLSQPLVSSGQVWFASPDRFRWELGQPPQTIALRQPDRMLVIYPKLQRMEIYSLTNASGPSRDALALLEAGFPRSHSELQARYRLLSTRLDQNLCTVILEPRASTARKMMPKITLAFKTNDFQLHFTEMQFADGSTLRNEFKNTRQNEIIADKMFRWPDNHGFRTVRH